MVDVGQSTANGLYQQAVAGTFKLEPGAAEKAAGVFQRFAQSIDKLIQDSYQVHRLSGFGDFTSAKQLAAGFETKGNGLTQVLLSVQAAALEMAAAYLRAANELQKSDDLHSQSLKIIASEIQS